MQTTYLLTSQGSACGANHADRIKTPDVTEIKFGTVDYVDEGTCCAKFHPNLPEKTTLQISEIYANFFIYLFSETHLHVRPLSGFLRTMAQTMRSHTRTCILGFNKFEINTKHIY